MHVNPVTEVCLCLSGEALLHADGAPHRLRPPSLFVIPSGIRHSEGYYRPDRSYRLLWLILSEPALGGVVVNYRPGERWTVLGRFHLHAAGSADLARLVKAGEVPQQFALWRSALVAVLGEAHHQLLSRQNQAVAPALNAHQGLLDQVRAILDATGSQPALAGAPAGPVDVTVRQLAQMTRLSERYLNRLFRQYAGQPIHEYLTERRMHQAMELCRRGDMLVKEIALQLGYRDPLYFSRAFHKFFGLSPTEARQRP